MDNPNTSQSLFNLGVNDNLKTHLRSTAVVAGIAAILFLINSILKLVAAFVNGGKTVIENRYEGFNQATASVSRTSNIAGAIFWLVICILLFYFLNKFSSQTKAGLDANNPQIINNGFSGLSAYMVTIGILLIIFFALALLGIMIGISAGAK